MKLDRVLLVVCTFTLAMASASIPIAAMADGAGGDDPGVNAFMTVSAWPMDPEPS